jgi:hypothetical protein
MDVLSMIFRNCPYARMVGWYAIFLKGNMFHLHDALCILESV